MQDFYKKPIFLHLVLIVLGLLLSIFLFFKPVVIDGRALNAHDNEQSQAMTKEIDDFEVKTGRSRCGPTPCLGVCQPT